MAYPLYMQPINTGKLGIRGYKRLVFALHSGGMTLREISRETGLRERDVRRIIVEVWATDLSALKAEKELAELNKGVRKRRKK